MPSSLFDMNIAIIMKCLLCLIGAILPFCTFGVTFQVTSAGDSGPGTLRQAILDANLTPGRDDISFNLPGSGPHSVVPLSPLPTVTDPVAIDGATQPGFSGKPIIELSGPLAGASANGLWITAGNCSVRGLVINRFALSGILIENRGSNVVVGNFIGTGLGGTNAAANLFGVSILSSSNNTIGLPDSASRNVVSGNGSIGIRLQSASDNVVEGNYVGTDVTGSFAIGNGSEGILIESAANRNTIGGSSAGAGNVISGNGSNGIYMVSSTGNVIEANFIGVDVCGTNAMPNLSGIELTASSFNTIGGNEEGDGNVLSGNRLAGLFIITGTGNVVQGNLIGTDATGSRAVGNQYGIVIEGAPANTIGGTTPGMGNVISGNSGAISITDIGATNNVIQGNLIGTDETGQNLIATARIVGTGIDIDEDADFTTIGGTESGAGNVIVGVGIGISLESNTNQVYGNSIGVDASDLRAMSNRSDGILIFGNGNLIGGTEPGAANHIAFSGSDGIRIPGPHARGNTIAGNSIWRNRRLGINLGFRAGEVTLNDVDDSDTGANNLQNFPTLTNIIYTGSSVIVQGFLRSTPDRSFAIDFYANVAIETNGYGEGQQYIGRLAVDTDATGYVEFGHQISGIVSNQYITATATDEETGDTSEFSAGAGGLRITNVSRDGANVAVSFTTYHGRQHRLEFASSLSGVVMWQAVPGGESVGGTGGIVSVQHMGVSGSSTLFYRVRLL